MEEGNVGVQERPLGAPMMENQEEMKSLRDKIRDLHYSRTVEEQYKDRNILPETVQQLRDGLDDAVSKVGQQEFDDKERNKGAIPEHSLAHEDEKFWEKIGWNERDRNVVIAKLMDVLKIQKHQAESAMHCLVAERKTPREVLDVLNAAPRFDAYPEDNTPEAKRLEQRLKSDRYLSGDPRIAQKFFYIEDKLGINNVTYIRRFILDDEVREVLNAEYDSELPQNLFDLGWNMGYRYQSDFGMNGRFPILQMQVNIDPATGKVKDGRYVVNQANFNRWMRMATWEWYEVFDTDEISDYFQKIQIHKGQFATINLTTMLFDKHRYFEDEKGVYWQRLYDQVLLEPWMMYFQRAYAIEYYNNRHDEQKLAETYMKMFELSKLSRKVYGRSMFQMLATLPVDFEGKDSDTKMGEAFLTMLMVYYNLSDFDELVRVLGKDSPFFTLDGWIQAAKDYAGPSLFKQWGIPQVEQFFGYKEENFAKAFDAKTGKIKSVKDFLKFINLWEKENTSQTVLKVLEQMLKNTVKHKLASKEGKLNSPDNNSKTEDGKTIDDFSLNYAWLMAYSWSFFTGAMAKNNFPGVSGHLADTKWYRTLAYRLKYMGFGGAGNPYSVFQFKQIGVPFLEGVLLENANEHYIYTYKDGKPVWKSRNLTPLEVMSRMQEESQMYDRKRNDLLEQLKNETDESARNSILLKLTALDEVAKNSFKTHGSLLEFNDQAMGVYARNLIDRGRAIYEQVMKGQETAFEKFTKYDSVFRGVSFNREEWQSALQSKMITPLRYLFEANGATQLNMNVRTPVYIGKDKDGKPMWRYETMSLGEAMMGHEMLDIPEFRKEVGDVSPEHWRELKRLGFRKRGKYIVDPSGKNVIDPNKLQEKKSLVYKQWMLTKIAADLWAHIDRHSTDPAFTMDHYMNILEAIENLPGDLAGSEFHMKGTRIPKGFFSEEQMKWLRRISGTTRTKLFTRQFFADLFIGDKRKKESLFGESTSIILGAIFRGY
ncbi:MAG TPA: hypothetical protein VND99_00470 [Candidatus Acidoferrales bacterium]|nr:hypothetical protein [Candidatus Acidoferrales bacterium]